MMKRQVRHIGIMLCAAVCCGAFLSCRQERVAEELSYPDVPMAVRLFSRASSPDTCAARLFFWDERHLDEVGADGILPYYECILPGVINDYSEQATRYNTGHYYPQLNTRVYALGFSPVGLQAVEAGNYGTYYLPLRNGEDTTVLASNHIVGSSVYVFRDPMEFRPATTRFIFRAIRHRNMYENLYVDNITLDMPPDAVPNVLRWCGTDFCYRAGYDTELDRGAGQVTANPVVFTGSQLNTSEYTLLGTRYLALPDGARSLRGMTVRARMSYEQDFPEGDKTWYRTWPDPDAQEDALDIPLLDLSGNRVSEVKPGESYVVTIIFDQDIFTITAEQVEWENGGKIPVPIVPPEADKP